MDNLRFHIMPGSGVGKVVLHRDHHPLFGLTRENVYPEEQLRLFDDIVTAMRGRSPLSNCLPAPRAYDCLYWQQDLHIEERGGRYLVIEPGSAGVMVLDERMWRLFRLMENPVPYRYVIHNYHAQVKVTDSFIEECRTRNLLCLEGSPDIFEHCGARPSSIYASASARTFLKGRHHESQSEEEMIKDFLRGSLPDNPGALPSVEIFLGSPDGDLDLLRSLLSGLRASRGYENASVMLHMPLREAQVADSVNDAYQAHAAFWAWNGVFVRAYPSSVQILLQGDSSLRGKLQTLVDNDILESLSMTVSDIRDFDTIEELIQRNGVSELRLFPAGAGNAGSSGGIEQTCLEAEQPDGEEHGLTDAARFAEAFVGFLERLPIEKRLRVFPVNHILLGLIHGCGVSPCMQRGLQYSTARITIDCGSPLPAEGALCERGAGSKIIRSGYCRRIDCWRCASITEHCSHCRWRRLCPGVCAGMSGWSGGTDEKTLCAFYRELIPEILTRSSFWLQ